MYQFSHIISLNNQIKISAIKIWVNIFIQSPMNPHKLVQNSNDVSLINNWLVDQQLIKYFYLF